MKIRNEEDLKRVEISNEFLDRFLQETIDNEIVVELPENWRGPNGVISLTFSKGKIRATGLYPNSDPLGLLQSKIYDSAQQLQIIYTGTLFGRAAGGTLQIRISKPTSKLITKREARFLVSENLKQIDVGISLGNPQEARVHKLTVAK